MCEDFFDLVLPKAGHRCIASQSNGKWLHAYRPENEGAAERAKALEVAGHSNVYFACASYDDPARGRKGHNVESVRSFWLDLDTNEFKIHGETAYAGKQDALEALARFCCELDISAITVVSSGFGIHVYWSMTDDMTPTLWSETAHVLRRACNKWGLKVDHSRTTDIASILRVPGTTNRKDPENPQPVQLLDLGSPISFADFRLKLDAYVRASDPFSSSQAFYEGVGGNTQLVAAYPPSDAHLIAERCAVMRHIRDTAGNVSEPLWFAGLGVLVHTVESDAACHDWSRGHPDYDFVKTQAKIERAKTFGPTLCERFEILSDGLCDGCPHKASA